MSETTTADAAFAGVMEQFEANLEAAAKLDPEAWEAPLRTRLHHRRIRSYFTAKQTARQEQTMPDEIRTAAQEPPMEIETKHYSDGTIATGVAPLPELSPGQQDNAEARERRGAELERLANECDRLGIPEAAKILREELGEQNVTS